MPCGAAPNDPGIVGSRGTTRTPGNTTTPVRKGNSRAPRVSLIYRRWQAACCSARGLQQWRALLLHTPGTGYIIDTVRVGRPMADLPRGRLSSVVREGFR